MSRVNFAVPAGFLDSLLGTIETDTTAGDSCVLSFNSKPSGADIYIDWDFAGETPLDSNAVARNTHTNCVVQEGFDLWMKDSLFLHNARIDIPLSRHKNLHLTLEKKGAASPSATNSGDSVSRMQTVPKSTGHPTLVFPPYRVDRY
ncbi:MAG: PEGA domain-containing protein [Chitinivibrionales bacterium]|nr:PEGA domain-containing protein [Chitinivibrionales bacterium]